MQMFWSIQSWSKSIFDAENAKFLVQHIYLPVDLENLLQRQETTTAHPGDTDAGSSHLRCSLDREHSAAGKGQFEILPLDY